MLHEAIQKAEAEGFTVLQFPVKPVITGYSGTWDVKIAPGDYHDIEMSFQKLRIIFSSYWNELVSRITKPFQ